MMFVIILCFFSLFLWLMLVFYSPGKEKILILTFLHFDNSLESCGPDFPYEKCHLCAEDLLSAPVIHCDSLLQLEWTISLSLFFLIRNRTNMTEITWTLAFLLNIVLTRFVFLCCGWKCQIRRNRWRQMKRFDGMRRSVIWMSLGGTFVAEMATSSLKKKYIGVQYH